ncbi:MAG: sulfatase-like hydrolase/transferase [Cyclobacteriaceae bacterium]|nr:sulfatase-like hydrolase/transferase [Cyclobacteriaceae bacterium]
MNSFKLFPLLFIFSFLAACAQPSKPVENVFLVTFDGLRWQEVFHGADSSLISDKNYTQNPKSLMDKFWDEDNLRRRELLLPFFWNVLAAEGQLYGNRLYENHVNCTNTLWFSYPGYSEILCGFSDDETIHSNDKIPNPNVTVLEFLNKQKGFKNKVAAFGSWDVFPYIINEERSGIPVNAGFEDFVGKNISGEVKMLNKLQKEIRSPWETVRLDAFTHNFMMEYVKEQKPRVVYISYGETDDFAHDGHYDEYLKSAKQTDAFISELWNYIQSDDTYRNKTALLITTDHGRGTDPKDTWRSHGKSIENAGEIWLAAIGPDIKALGEVKVPGQSYQNQIATTICNLLGVDYISEKAAGKAIETIMVK